ncbi:MAG: putative chaperone protein [Alteromonadaceae bacterium]|jgi:hypothetical chaperone protein
MTMQTNDQTIDHGNSHFCGIDFGTSNSTIGLFDNASPVLVALEDNKLDMPSTIFFDQYDGAFFGREAIERYIDGNQGRFMRSMKSVLGSSLMSTNVGSSSLQFERVIAIYIKELKIRAEQDSDKQLTHAVIGRPVHFVDDNTFKDQQAQESLEKAAKLAGFKEVSFQYEPIAAALAYESTLAHEELALIIDIGGGTSDFTLIRLSPERGVKADRTADILATTGVHVGGTDLDKQLSLKRVMPHFGYKAQNIHKPNMQLPVVPFSNFASWHLINTLYEKSSILEIKDMRIDIAEKHLIDRFIKVIERREAHRVALGVEAAKVGLSDNDAVSLNLDFVEQGFDIAVDKADFNHTIMDSCEKVVASMRDCMSQAGVKPAEVASVFLTGGTTSVDLFRSQLVTDFAHANIVDGDKFGSVGLGLTLHAEKVFR